MAAADQNLRYVTLDASAFANTLDEGCWYSSAADRNTELWVTTGEHEDLAQAARMAAEEMVMLMQEKGGLSFEQAYMLMSGAVDVQICQCCELGEFPTTTRAVVPKALLSS